MAIVKYAFFQNNVQDKFYYDVKCSSFFLICKLNTRTFRKSCCCYRVFLHFSTCGLWRVSSFNDKDNQTGSAAGHRASGHWVSGGGAVLSITDP